MFFDRLSHLLCAGDLFLSITDHNEHQQWRGNSNYRRKQSDDDDQVNGDAVIVIGEL